MKLKFSLVLLVIFGFVVGSYASCSKDEFIKFIDKGYSKTEIDVICGKSENTETKEKKKEVFKWISQSATNNVCKSNGGEIKNEICEAEWSDAKKICSASGGRLPSVDELKRVVRDCGGEIANDIGAIWDKNAYNSSYQSCYKNKRFSSTYYWSTTSNVSDTNNAWYVHFYNGDSNNYAKSNINAVRCVGVEL